MRTVVLISSAALALAACQKSPAAEASDATAGPAAAPTSTSGPPRRRAGLWEQSFSRDGQPTPMGSMKMCTDPTAEAKASIFGRDVAAQHTRDAGCSAPVTSRGLDGSYAFASTCSAPSGGTTVTKGMAKGDFGVSYQVHIETLTTGAAYAAINGRHVMDISGKWLGPCPAGMSPGDMELANGMRFPGGRLAGAAAAAARAGQ